MPHCRWFDWSERPPAAWSGANWHGCLHLCIAEEVGKKDVELLRAEWRIEAECARLHERLEVCERAGWTHQVQRASWGKRGDHTLHVRRCSLCSLTPSDEKPLSSGWKVKALPEACRPAFSSMMAVCRSPTQLLIPQPITCACACVFANLCRCVSVVSARLRFAVIYIYIPG